MRLRLIGAAAIACALALVMMTAAEAKPRHRSTHVGPAAASHCDFTNAGRVICGGTETRTTGRLRVTARHVEKSATIVGGRPHGCPHAFCGCEASLYVFGKIVPYLNLAANWIRKFPRAHPAPGMAAARSGHVMVLISHVSGDDWLVHDGNSGGHLTREHVRSIAGYVIVDPRARTAGL